MFTDPATWPPLYSACVRTSIIVGKFDIVTFV